MSHELKLEFANYTRRQKFKSLSQTLSHIDHIESENNQYATKISENHTYFLAISFISIFVVLTIGTKKITRSCRAYTDELLMTPKSPEKQF